MIWAPRLGHSRPGPEEREGSGCNLLSLGALALRVTVAGEWFCLSITDLSQN